MGKVILDTNEYIDIKKKLDDAVELLIKLDKIGYYQELRQQIDEYLNRNGYKA